MLYFLGVIDNDNSKPYILITEEMNMKQNKVVKLPENTIPVQDEGMPVIQVSVVVQLLKFAVDRFPQKSKTEAFIVDNIQEKLDHARENPLVKEIEFAPEEMFLINQSLDNLRAKELMMGRNWVHVIKALEGATDAVTSSIKKLEVESHG
jgi:hypothetical protein